MPVVFTEGPSQSHHRIQAMSSNKKRQNSNSLTPDPKKCRERTSSDKNGSTEENRSINSDLPEYHHDCPSATTCALILEKLECLPGIQNIISEVKNDIAEFKTSLEYTQGEVDELKCKVKQQECSIKSLETKVSQISLLQEENKKLRNDLDALEGYGRRENLLFLNIDESTGEDCKMILHKLFAEKLGLQTSVVSSMRFQRAHRLGQPRQDGKPRPIIARFCFFEDREKVWSSRFKLKGTPIIINEDYPQSIIRKRNALYPVYKQAKEQDLKTRLVGDKLHIEGKIYSTETIHQVTSEIQMRQKVERITEKYHLFSGRYSPFSNFFPAPFKLNGLQFSCNEQFYQHEKAMACGNHQAATSIMMSQDPVLMKKIGDGLQINHKLWREKGKDVMMQGLQAKFKQNQALADTLKATRSHTLVECNAFDRIWGNGLRLHDKLSDDCTTWKGENLLGSCLDKVRNELFLSND